MREAEIEAKLRRKVEAMGCLCWKFVSPGRSGVPDRIILVPGGYTIFAELKAPGKRERPLQEYVQSILRGMGFKVFSSVDSDEKINEVCRYIRCVREERHG